MSGPDTSRKCKRVCCVLTASFLFGGLGFLMVHGTHSVVKGLLSHLGASKHSYAAPNTGNSSLYWDFGTGLVMGSFGGLSGKLVYSKTNPDYETAYLDKDKVYAHLERVFVGAILCTLLLAAIVFTGKSTSCPWILTFGSFAILGVTTWLLYRTNTDRPLAECMHQIEEEFAHACAVFPYPAYMTPTVPQPPSPQQPVEHHIQRTAEDECGTLLPTVNADEEAAAETDDEPDSPPLPKVPETAICNKYGSDESRDCGFWSYSNTTTTLHKFKCGVHGGLKSIMRSDKSRRRRVLEKTILCSIKIEDASPAA